MIINILNKISIKIGKLYIFARKPNLKRMKRRINSGCKGMQAHTIYNKKTKTLYIDWKKIMSKRKAITSTKLEIKIYVRILYALLKGCNYHQLNCFHGVSDRAVVKIKM